MIFHKELKELLDILEIGEEDILKKKGNMWGLVTYDMHRAEQYIDRLVSDAENRGETLNLDEYEKDKEDSYNEGKDDMIHEVTTLCEKSLSENLEEYLEENELTMADMTPDKIAEFVKSFMTDKLY